MNGLALGKHPTLARPEGPVCLVVLDGVGLGPANEGNAWHLARTPCLDRLMAGPLVGRLAAHGRAVGMPTDRDMGNSEVGHNALGAGRVFDQGAKLVERAVSDGSLFGETWSWIMAPSRSQTLHLIGLFSDGNVHSHIDHAYALVERAVSDGASAVRLHVLLDGRDVGETSALDYLKPLEARVATWRAAGHDVAVASGGGRMTTTMDRYEADWRVVERGWRAHVLGDGRRFRSASEAVATFRAEQPGIIDQNLPAFVVENQQGEAAGPIVDGDAVVFFNFRGDRAIEITRAFEAPADDPSFAYFDRQRVPKVRYAGMMQYDGDLQQPRRYLVAPPAIDRTVGQYLATYGLRQLAISETQKFGHVTTFYNGNRSLPFKPSLEHYVDVPSDPVDFAERPWMKAAEVTDRTLAELDSWQPDFVRLNYANGDMVGHTGQLLPAIVAMEALDLCLARLVAGVLARKGRLIITADHGNCETMFMQEKNGAFQRRQDGSYRPKTSHTLNPVPLMIVGAGAGTTYGLADVADPGIANLGATCLNLLGLATPPDYLPGLVTAL